MLEALPGYPDNVLAGLFVNAETRRFPWDQRPAAMAWAADDTGSAPGAPKADVQP